MVFYKKAAIIGIVLPDVETCGSVFLKGYSRLKTGKTGEKTGDQGYQFEWLLFGTHAREWKSSVVLEYATAVAYVRVAQSVHFDWNPQEPKTRYARELMDAVKRCLARADRSLLLLFVAIGTSLDKDHGIDAFFQVGETNRLATIDVTVGKGKHGTKAGIIIRAADFNDADALRKKAGKIADMLRYADGRLHPYPGADMENLRRVLKEKLEKRKQENTKQIIRERRIPLHKIRLYSLPVRPRLEKKAPTVEQLKRIEDLKRFLGL